MQLIGCVLAKNDEKVIGKCLQRLSESADGIIVLDDGSTDHTLEIVDSFDKVIKVFKNPPYKEWRPVRNIKMILDYVAQVAPEWFIIMDSDDVLDERFAGRKKELLGNKNVGRYHFKEITLWGSNKLYRVDKPEWYGRTRDRTPYLMRWNPQFTYTERYKEFPMTQIRWMRRQWLVGIIKRFLPHKAFTDKSNRIKKFLSEVFWPSDYMDYTNIFFTGYEGQEVEIPLVRMHYHFADMNYAWKKHMNYALNSVIRQHRTLGEMPEIIDWASEKLGEENMVLEEVKPEWGAL